MFPSLLSSRNIMGNNVSAKCVLVYQGFMNFTDGVLFSLWRTGVLNFLRILDDQKRKLEGRTPRYVLSSKKILHTFHFF